MNMTVESKDEKKDQSSSVNAGWKINQNGINKMSKMINVEKRTECKNMNYNEFEKFLHEMMNECFYKRKNLTKNNNRINRNLIVRYKTVAKLATKGKIQRKIAHKYRDMILEESMKTTSKMRTDKIKKVLMSLTEEQKFSVNGFWKLKKSSQYNKQMCSSIETENGTEIYGKEMVLNEYKKEFEERLRPREIGKKLQRYQELTNELSKMYTDIAEKEI